jgi:hypothetical protein
MLDRQWMRTKAPTFCVMLEALQADGTIMEVKNPHAVALGRLGGLKGGPTGGRARAASLTPERRAEISRRAAAARWEGQLPDLLRPLFWQYRFEDIRLPDATNEVMMQVISIGRPEHVAWLRRRFGDAGIRRWIRARKGRGLTRSQMARWVSGATAAQWQQQDPNALLWEQR